VNEKIKDKVSSDKSWSDLLCVASLGVAETIAVPSSLALLQLGVGRGIDKSKSNQFYRSYQVLSNVN